MSISRRWPGIDHTANLANDDLEFEESVVSDEVRRRTQYLMGAARAAGASYGIVAETDPRAASSSIESPLLVRRNVSDKTKFDVVAGPAVTKLGDILYLTTTQELISPAVSLAAGDQFVIFLEYNTEDDTDTREPNVYRENVARRRVRLGDADLVSIERAETFQDTTVYSSDRKEHIVLLALITVAAENDGSLRLDVSLTTASLADNRPWFSPVDIEHRAMTGGAFTAFHGIGFNDLTSGSLTLYQQMCRHGMVLGRAQSYPGVPGLLCSEQIQVTYIDSDGTVTGTVGAKYVVLSRFPTRLLGVSSYNDPTVEIAARLLSGTNILVLHPDEYLTNANVYYAAVSAGEADPTQIVNNEVVFGQPAAGTEAVIAGGKAHETLLPQFTDAFGVSKTKISLGLAGPFPRRYQVWADGTGSLLLAPQILLCATALDRVGLAEFPLTGAPVASAKIIVGLTNTPDDASMNLTVRVSGVDANAGTQTTEDITFVAANYDPTPTIPTNDDAPGYYVKTATTFAADTVTVKVITKTAIASTALVMVLADLDPLVSSDLRDACPLAELTWTGQTISRIRDMRPVATTIAGASQTSPAKLAAQATLAAISHNSTVRANLLVADDLRDPRFASVARGTIKTTPLSDGLVSTRLPVQPSVDSDESLEGVYYSQALTLPDGSTGGQHLHVALFGEDAGHFLVMPNSGVAPFVQYRVGQKAGAAWGSWTTLAAATSGDKVSYFVSLGSDYTANFKIQFRIKGSIVGFAAFLRALDVYPKLVTLTDGASIATDASTGTTFMVTVTATARVMAAPTNLVAGETYRWIIKQGGAGSYTVTFNAIWKWTAGSAPAVNTATGTYAVITSTYDGTYLLSSSVINLS